MDKRQWKEIEDEFRVWSFHIYYNRSFRDEHDPDLRFIKALKASVQPIRDRGKVLEWYRKRKELGKDCDDNEETETRQCQAPDALHEPSFGG